MDEVGDLNTDQPQPAAANQTTVIRDFGTVLWQSSHSPHHND